MDVLSSTCNMPLFAGKRRILKGNVLLCFGMLYLHGLNNKIRISAVNDNNFVFN